MSPIWRWMVIAAVLVPLMAGSAEAASSSITLSALPNPVRFGQAATLTATVAPATATGKVTFYRGISVIGIAPVALGKATLTTTSLAAGPGVLTAYYSGDGMNAASRSVQVPMAVNSVVAQGFQMVFQAVPGGPISLQFPALAAGDFNGDGKLDLAASGGDPSATSLVILLGNGDGTFKLGQKYTAAAYTIVSADFNGDGRPDLACLSSFGSTLAILLGNGDGTFQAPAKTTVDGARMVAADFNGDGVADLAVGSGGSSNLTSVLLGKGDGTFAAPAPISGTTGSGTLALADFNGDGTPDLAVQLGASTFQIYLGKGDGTFIPKGSPVAVTGTISDLAVGDFNGDGRIDLTVGNNKGISLFEGHGDGTLSAPRFMALGRETLQLAVTDVDGDGHPDVVTGTNYPLSNDGITGSFAVLTGDGAGGLTLNLYHDQIVTQAPFVLGDFNGDGRVDLVEGLTGPNVYLGLGPTDLSINLAHSGNAIQGQTGLTLTSLVTNLGPAALTSRVVESFQVPDGLTMTNLTGAGWDCRVPTCVRSDGLAAGASFPPVTATVSIGSTAAASVSVTATLAADGMSDPNPANDIATDSITVRQNQSIVFGSLPDVVAGTAPFLLKATATSGLLVAYSAAGNCNVNEGVATVTGIGSCTITAGQSGNDLYLAAPNVSRTFVIGAAATSVSLAAPGTTAVGAGVTLTATVTPASAQGRVFFYDGAILLGTAPVNGGTAQLTVRVENTGIRKMYARFSGAAPWPGSMSSVAKITVTAQPGFTFNSTVISSSVRAYDQAVGDFNGDGLPDIVAVGTGFIYFLPGNGTGGFGATVNTQTTALGQTPLRLAVGDFNGDGKLDTAIAPQTSVGGAVAIFLGRGDGTFQQGATVGGPAGSIVAADFNGDGYADLAVTRPTAPTVSVLLSRGDGTFETAIDYVVSGNYTAAQLIAADLNGDGATDLIAVTTVGSIPTTNTRVNVLLGQGDGTFLQPAGWVDDFPLADAPPGSVLAGDLNGDGIPDVVIQSAFSYPKYRCSVTALVGNGDGTFQPPSHYECSETSQVSADGTPNGMAIADFTGDGKADIAALYTFNDGYVQLFPGNGDGTFTSAAVYQFGNVGYLSQAGVGDFNGDGKVDLAVGKTGSVTVLAGGPSPGLHIAIAPFGTIGVFQKAASTITVTNAPGAATTSGTVSVIFNTSVNVALMTGTGWSCTSSTCTRSDPLTGGSGYPPIAVQLQVFGADLPFTNSVSVSGGGSAAAEAQVAAITVGSGLTGAIASVNTVGATTASQPAIGPNDWIEIHGINLVPANTPATGVVWSSAPDFAAGKMPTQLNGVSATVNGKPAYIYFYCSAATDPACVMDQINVLTPPDLALDAGIAAISVAGSEKLNVSAIAATPSFLRFGASRYVTASHADYSLIGPASLYPGLTTPARRGETVLLWGAGFGLPTMTITPGSVVQAGALPGKITCTVGARAADAIVALVSPGEYQVNLTIPADSKSGDQPVSCTYGGVSTPDGNVITVQ